MNGRSALFAISSSTSRAFSSFAINNSLWTLKQNPRPWIAFKSQKREKHGSSLSRSVVKNLNCDLSDNNGENESIESARVLLERLFVKTQNLEISSQGDSELNSSLEGLKSEFEAALSTLRKREIDLKEAEKRVLIEERKLNETKLVLERREREISASFEKQKLMNEELERNQLNLARQARQINDLKFLMEEKDKYLTDLKSTIMEKSAKIEDLKSELIKKDETVRLLQLEIKPKEENLIEFEKVFEEKNAEITELKQEIERKETELSESNKLRKLNEDKLITAERELEKQTNECIEAQNELKQLELQANKQINNNIKESFDDFERVRSLLSVLRSELECSTESLSLSRVKLELQAKQIEKQSEELNEQRDLFLSFSENLKNMKLEIERENSDLENKQNMMKQLELDVSLEREKVDILEGELAREREKLKEKTQDVLLLRTELEKKNLDFKNLESILQIRESELVESGIQIQDLKSEFSSTRSAVERKDSELSEARKKLEGVNCEIAQLNELLVGKEEQFVQLMSRLEEKEHCISAMQDELQGIRIRYAKATSVVQTIADLTGESLNGEDELDMRLEMIKESLENKEVELVEAKRQLAVKEQELNSMQERWREFEILEIEKPGNEILGNADELRELYSAVQQQVGERNLGNLVTQKLELELAKLEAQAVSIALKNVYCLTQKLVEITDGNGIVEFGGSNLKFENETDGFEEAEREVYRILSLSERILKDSGINKNESS
ncbi:hypothetical protein LUZ60_017147 [Juncus effusus]|nr:hypothetical protein LUZ60_017147 [Juncus effusus]